MCFKNFRAKRRKSKGLLPSCTRCIINHQSVETCNLWFINVLQSGGE
ncbi:hypothetical protein LINPERHAP1_LOCUS15939, partial [Linum perenne]